MELPEIKLKHEETASKITFLNEEEIQLLYQATHKDPNRKYESVQITEALQARDRAMVTIFYVCGLRRNEGVHLDVPDINFEKHIIHVRKGKNNKERLVPLSKTGLEYLTDYLYNHRTTFLRTSKTEALFIGYKTTNRLQGQTLNLRLKYLQYESENLELQEKEIGLHTLRHSIATHFLKAGMKLESISRFLGHSSLESTQIYTHLEETKEAQNYPNIPKYETQQLHQDE
jgi:integrase/recombinase XerD